MAVLTQAQEDDYFEGKEARDKRRPQTVAGDIVQAAGQVLKSPFLNHGALKANQTPPPAIEYLFTLHRQQITDIARDCVKGMDAAKSHADIHSNCKECACAPVVQGFAANCQAVLNVAQLVLGASGLEPSPLTETDLDLFKSLLRRQYDRAKSGLGIEASKLRSLQMDVLSALHSY